MLALFWCCAITKDGEISFSKVQNRLFMFVLAYVRNQRHISLLFNFLSMFILHCEDLR
jgi:hypothetical protein